MSVRNPLKDTTTSEFYFPLSRQLQESVSVRMNRYYMQNTSGDMMKLNRRFIWFIYFKWSSLVSDKQTKKRNNVVNFPLEEKKKPLLILNFLQHIHQLSPVCEGLASFSEIRAHRLRPAVSLTLWFAFFTDVSVNEWLDVLMCLGDDWGICCDTLSALNQENKRPQKK